MSLQRCERCESTEFVKRFSLFAESEPGGEEILCWDCRWPYIRARVHGQEATGPPGDVKNSERHERRATNNDDTTAAGGQTSIADF